MADFDPGEVFDALNDDRRFKARAKQVDEMAKALVDLCETALHEMAKVDEREDGQFAEDLSEHEAAFIDRLAGTAVHVAVERWKDRRREEALEEAGGA